MKRTVLAVMLSVLLVSTLGFTFNIQPAGAGGTIYIRADGSVDPSSAPIHHEGDIYTFTDNIYESVVVERDNIVVDGAGYTINGTGWGRGIDLSGRSNVTVKNMKIMAFFYGIYLDLSSNNTILGNNLTANKDYAIWSSDFNGFWNSSIVGNNITNNGGGIRLRYPSSHNNISDNRITANNWTGITLAASQHNILFGNNITANKGFGIWLTGSSSNTTLRNNIMAKNKYNFAVDTWRFEFYLNDVDVSNTVDGKPIYYWINRRDKAVPLDAGYVALINCTNITARNLNLTTNGQGLLLVRTINSTISQNNIANNYDGIYLDDSSSNNSISYNNMTNNGYAIFGSPSTNNTISYNNITGGSVYLSGGSGNHISHNNLTSSTISLTASSNNVISHNNIRNGGWGIDLARYSNNNNISYNNIADNSIGIELTFSSSSNVISYNSITNGYVGIWLNYASNNNNISNNNIANNLYALWLDFGSSKNAIYHNNFLNNTYSVDAFGSGGNVLDDGYPDGGNHWSNYEGTDWYKGPYQNETGSDGIGDSPYVVNADNKDRYPLMKPYAGPHDIGIEVFVSKTIVAEGYNTTITINTTIINYGTQTETFNFTFQINTTIQEQTLALASRNSTIKSSTWDTTELPKGNYTITATATPVPGETDTADNSFTGWLIVAMIGDVSGTDGWPDGKVNIMDLTAIAKIFGVNYPDPRYNANYDLNDDGKINIADLTKAAKHFGEPDP